MGRAPCCDKANVKRGPWSPDEDNTLRNYLEKHGTGGNWIALPRKAGLKRCGKSCRLRWLNYLRPDIKHGGFTEEEDNIICSLYSSIGSRWSVIAAQLPGRTDNDVKNYWNTKLKKKLMAGKIGLDKNSQNEITITDSSSTSNIISGEQVSASVPIEAEARANGNSDYLNANGSSTSSSYMTDMKYQQNYEYPGLFLDQLPGLMEHSSTTANNNNNSMSISSQEVSIFSSSSSSFPPENNYTTSWSSNGGADQDQGILLDQLHFEEPLYLFSGSSFQENSSEVAPCFGIFSSSTA